MTYYHIPEDLNPNFKYCWVDLIIFSVASTWKKDFKLDVFGGYVCACMCACVGEAHKSGFVTRRRM
jgi:hypothetical protein